MYITHTHYVRMCAVAKKFDIAKIYEIIKTRTHKNMGEKNGKSHNLRARH